MRHGYATLLDRARHHAPAARIEGVLVAKQIKGAVEMALGILRDPVFGPVAMVGLGGIFIEVLKDVSLPPLPLRPGGGGAHDPLAPRLPAARRRRAAARAPTCRRWPARCRRSPPSPSRPGRGSLSVDVNPMLVLPEGQGCYAADAVIEVGGGEAH